MQKKISELPELTTPDSADYIPINDSSEATTKRITLSTLFSRPSSIGSTTPAVGSFTTLTATKNLYVSPSELTISSGAITITQSLHRIDTQSDAETDDLETINGGSSGQVLIIRAEHEDRTVVIKNNIGNILTNGSDVKLDSTNKYIYLVYDGILTKWVIIGSSVELSEPGPIGETTPNTVKATKLTMNSLSLYCKGETVTDNGTFNLPTISNSGMGMLIVGADEERAMFSIDSSGNVYLWSYSDNIVANSDTDDKFCIGTSVANPLTIKNRLGSTKMVVLNFWYN